MARLNHLVLTVFSAAAAMARQCQNLTIPVSISARNGRFDFQIPENDTEVTNFVLNLTQPGHNLTAELLTGYATVSGNYSLAATYCTPDGGPGKALQILTHGVGFDRSYWDYPIDGHRYSYVGAATARNYSTFAYDRLGIGESSRGADPVDEIQSALEVAALRALTLGLRGAALPGVPDAYGTTFHVGHSYGSIQTYGLTAGAAGDGEVVSDGIALTGFSMASQFLPYFLLGGNFVSASPGTAQKNVTTAASSSSSSSSSSSYGYGYFAAGDAAAVQTNFFAPGMFDPDVLEAATRTGQPVTVGELLTLGQPVSGCSNGFEGPVLVVTGDRDLPFCGGNCSATPGLSVPAMVQSNFTNASDFETLIVPSGGHALNLTTYDGILNFFDKYAD